MKKAITLVMEKATKNTIRFTEKLSSDLDVPTLGTIYVPKQTLKEIGWTDGKSLTVELSC